MKVRGKKILTTSIACLFALWMSGPMANAKNADADGGMSIYDGEPTEADCRMCHDDLNSFPMLLATNPDRHHALSADCLSCHSFVWNDALGAEVISSPRDCLTCHEVSDVEGALGSTNVHHQTATFADRDCAVCHTR